jgi:hypothetical protein
VTILKPKRTRHFKFRSGRAAATPRKGVIAVGATAITAAIEQAERKRAADKAQESRRLREIFLEDDSR